MKARKNERRQRVVGTFPSPSPLSTASVRAHIDLITFAKPGEEFATKELKQTLLELRSSGRLEVPRRQSEFWLTLHDPTARQLEKLVNAYYFGEIQDLEIAVDFFLPPALDSIAARAAVHRYLRHGLAPTEFRLLDNARRRYSIRKGHIALDKFAPRGPAFSTYWWNRKHYATLKLYDKVLDRGKPAQPKRVRVELALNRGGCQDLNVFRLAQLPDFLYDLRRIVAAAFTVANGAKFNPRVTKSKRPSKLATLARVNMAELSRVSDGFSRWGSMWCVKHGIKPAPDARMTRVVGSALQQLSRRFKTVRLRPEIRKRVGRYKRKIVSIYQ